MVTYWVRHRNFPTNRGSPQVRGSYELEFRKRFDVSLRVLLQPACYLLSDTREDIGVDRHLARYVPERRVTRLSLENGSSAETVGDSGGLYRATCVVAGCTGMGAGW